MAMTYQNFASLGVNLNRQKYGPLDISNVFTSAADLKYYLSKGTFTEGVSEYWYKDKDNKVVPYPYEGQVLATVIDGVVSVYALSLDAEGNFQTQEIGAKIETDEKTIKLVDGKLELVGLPEVTVGKTFVPSLVNGVLTWAEPDTSTAEGQQQAIDGLTASVAGLGEILNGKPESEEGAGDAVVGLVDKVAALEAVDNATQAELDAYKEVVTAAITAGVKEAKDYADAQDADTVYDDTELAGRVSAIEADYLKTADKYDDTALAGRVTTAEGKITTLEGVVGDTESGLVKAIADEKARAEAAESDLNDRIDAIDFVDSAELATALEPYATIEYVDTQIEAVEDAISKLNHFTTKIVTSTDEVTETGILYLIKDESVAGVDKYNEYIVVDGAPVLIGDTTTDLSNYYNKTEIDGKVEALEGAIADEVEARGALAEEVAALKAVDNATQAELDAYKLEVTEAIRVAKEAAISDADDKLANKLDTTVFTEFQNTNTTAIATAKSEAIAAAAAAEEAKGYAVDADVKATYATKAELETHESEIANDLLAYAKTADVEAELAKKIETASIAHSTDEVAEGVTVNGTKLDIVVDAFTKAETRQYVADTITSFTGGESAKDVLLALNNYKSDNDARVGAIETKNGEQDTAIAAAQTQADKGVADAAKVAADLVTANGLIADNTREIGVAKDSINTVNTTLTEKITTLEGKDTAIEGNITALQTTVSGHTATITEQGTAITALQDKDIELATLIQGNTDKFANYSTTEQVNKAIDDKIAAIPAVDFTGYATETFVTDAIDVVNTEVAKKANADDVYTIAQADAKFMTEAQVKSAMDKVVADVSDTDTIEGLVTLVEYVHDNAGDIAKLVSDVENNGKAIAKNTEDISKNTSDIVAINEAIAAIVQPKASEEVTVADDGTLGLGEVSTDKLVQGTDTLVLNGGSAV